MGSTDQSESLGALILRRAAESPDSVFLEDARSPRIFTYRAFEAAVARWRAELDSLAIPGGAAVLLAIRDPLAFAIVHLAVISSGRRSVPINPDLPDGEPARTSALIDGAALVVFGPDIPTRSGTWATVSVTTSGDPAQPVLHGKSAAVLSDGFSTGAAVLFVARQVAANNALRPGDRGFNSLPLFHVNAEVVAVLATLVAGATVVLDDAFHRTGFWELLRQRRVTWLNAVPAILAVLARSGEMVPHTDLRFIRSASAPLPDAVRTALGSTPLVLSWGMTEGASQITATPIGDTSHPGSVGLPLGSEVLVRRTDGSSADADEIGALWIRGPGVVSGYLFGRAADRFDSAGWLETGDLGSIDTDGFVYLAGRSDDVINRGGEKVYPAEVEEVLLGDSRVREAVVVSRPDEILGSVPVAYVIPSEPDSTEAQEHDVVRLASDLGARCEVELPRFKRPSEIVIVQDLPRAPTGKVQRSRVRELAAQ